MAVANTLAYYDTATITAEKNFMVQSPGYFLADEPSLRQILTATIVPV